MEERENADWAAPPESVLCDTSAAEVDAGAVRRVLGRARWMRRAGWIVAVCLMGGALGWFCMRLSPDVGFGTWQGILLSEHPLEQPPVLSYWLSHVAAWLPGCNAAWRLNLLSAVCGALSCGLVCLLGARAAGAFLGAGEALAYGVLGALAFAATPAFVYEATGAGPSTLTLALAIGAISLLGTIKVSEEGSSRLYLAAWLSGLAMANHAAFGWLFAAVVFVLLQSGPPRRRAIRLATGCSAAWVAGAALPFARSRIEGESLREFLSHALQQPYPNLFDGLPSTEPLRQLVTNYPPVFLALAIVGLVFSFSPGQRHHGVLLAGLALCMGPLLPILTNQTGGAAALENDRTPLFLTMALTCIWASWGAARLVCLLPKHVARPWARSSLCAGLVLAACAGWPAIPSRNHTVARGLAERILDSCPPDAILVSGEPQLTSILRTAQLVCGIRDDVAVIPAANLAGSPLERRWLAEHLSGRVSLPDAFSLEHNGQAWSNEQPLALARFLEGKTSGTAESGLLDLALWEFVKANYQRGPLCFVGLDSQWLGARAAISGLVLTFPRLYPTAAIQPDAEIGRFIDDASLRQRDPGVARSLASLPLPLATAARAQGQCVISLRLASLAARLNPNAVEPERCILRAEARGGDKKAAMKRLGTVLVLAPSEQEAAELRAAIEHDLSCRAREQAFLDVVALETTERTPHREERTKAAQALWEVDELAVLAQGYDGILEALPEDTDARYQLAAVYVQLGNLKKARDALKLIIGKANMASASFAQRLLNDGRFVLLRYYDSGI